MGLIIYADDIFLLAPNRRAASIMLSICERFASENNIKFSTDPDPKKSKSKAMYVVGQRSTDEVPTPLSLCGVDLPWVSHMEHLGWINKTRL